MLKDRPTTHELLNVFVIAHNQTWRDQLRIVYAHSNYYHNLGLTFNERQTVYASLTNHKAVQPL